MIRSINTEFQMKLEQLIAEETARLTQKLIVAGGITTFADYEYARGQIAGLELAAYQFGAVNEFLDSKR